MSDVYGAYRACSACREYSVHSAHSVYSESCVLCIASKGKPNEVRLKEVSETQGCKPHLKSFAVLGFKSAWKPKVLCYSGL